MSHKTQIKRKKNVEAKRAKDVTRKTEKNLKCVTNERIGGYKVTGSNGAITEREKKIC